MNKPKVIVFSTAYLPLTGGSEIAIREISQRLRDDFDFVVITARLKKNLPKREINDGIEIVRLGLGYDFDKFILPVLGFFKARRYLKNPKCIIWGMDISTGSLAAALVKLFYKKILFVFTIQYGYGEKRIKHGRGGLI